MCEMQSYKDVLNLKNNTAQYLRFLIAGDSKMRWLELDTFFHTFVRF